MESWTIHETLAHNVRAYRQLRGLDQAELGHRMQSLGHLWRQVTVSEVERRQRSVSVPEMIALTLALGVTVEQLLDPRGPERRRGPRLALADHIAKITGDSGDTLRRQLQPLDPDDRLTIDPDDVTALLCLNNVYPDVDWDPIRHTLRRVEWIHGGPDAADAEEATS